MGESDLVVGVKYRKNASPHSYRNGRVILTFTIDGKYQIIWAFSRTFSIITAFHDIPLVIYPFYIVLNAFNCTTVVLVHIAGIIAHYRELLGAVWLCFIFF